MKQVIKLIAKILFFPYADGKKIYFDKDRNVLCMEDRFGNKIEFISANGVYTIKSSSGISVDVTTAIINNDLRVTSYRVYNDK